MKSMLMTALLSCCVSVQAAPVVIGDGEPTQSMASYYTPLGDFSVLDAQAKTIVEPSQLTAASLYPVATPELTTGSVATQPLEHPLPHPPFFIVNDDATNANWLREHEAPLKQQEAVGFVANVSTAARLAALQSLAPQLSISAVPMGAVANALHLTHVPVFITTSQVMQ